MDHERALMWARIKEAKAEQEKIQPVAIVEPVIVKEDEAPSIVEETVKPMNKKAGGKK